MAGVSTESQDALAQVFEQRFAADASTTTSNELFAVANLLDQNGSLRRGLTDPSREAEQRRGIAASVLEGKVYPAVRELATIAAGSRWSGERDLADALEHLAVLASAAAAERRGGQEAVTAVIEDLLRFTGVVEADARLQNALTDQRATAEAKKRLVSEVVSLRTPEGQELVNQAVEHPRGALPAQLAERFAGVLAALQKRSIAQVTVSAPLDDQRRDRLQRALSSIYGKDLALDLTVDPEIIGGIKVQVGDEVIDGSVLGRVSDLGRTMTAS
jgi:F-type H+-transporting ATPase subunit delta